MNHHFPAISRVNMKPRSPEHKDRLELSRSRLDSQINMNYELGHYPH